MDPLSWISAGTQLLNAVNGTSKGAEPGIATSGNAPAVINTDADFSGFTVATGQARATGATINKTSSDGLGMPAATIAGALQNVNPIVLIGGAVALAIVWRMLK